MPDMAAKIQVSTHSRPKAAGTAAIYDWANGDVSTHSRPKAAGIKVVDSLSGGVVSTHSRPKAAGQLFGAYLQTGRFQHTAARRRLVDVTLGDFVTDKVSTHSRPKAAGPGVSRNSNASIWFQHTAARRRLVSSSSETPNSRLFQHTAARRRLAN